MSDFLNKLIGVVLAFVLLAAGPLINRGLSQDLEMKRSVLNEITNFLDKVSDNGRINDVDVSNYYLALNSYGVAMDAHIERQIKVVNPDGAGGTYATYVVSDDITQYNQGDIVITTVKAIDYTGSQRVINRLMHLSPPKFDVTFSAMVRN